MESLDEIKAHQRMERGRQGKVGSRKVESPDESQRELIKGGKGTFFNGAARQAKGKGFGSKFAKVLLGFGRGFKILPDNGTKMLSHKLYVGKSSTQPPK